MGYLCKLGALDKGVAVLCHLESPHVHAIEFQVVMTLPEYLIVGQNRPVMSLWVARTFLVKMNNLMGSLVVSVNGGHPGLMHAVHGVSVPHVERLFHLGVFLLVVAIIFFACVGIIDCVVIVIIGCVVVTRVVVVVLN